MRDPNTASLTGSARQQFIVEVFESAYGDLMRMDSDAWRVKFRLMAATPHSFYRGSAVLFYSDLATDDDPFLENGASHVWIHGDLHVDNFGTYLDSTGRLLFDVIDFDEAYVGPFTWDLRRLAVSLALIGYDKALADDEIHTLVRAMAESYTAQVKRFSSGEDGVHFAITLENANGVALDVLQSARLMTRVGLLDSATEIKDGDRRFKRDQYRSTIPDEMWDKLTGVFDDYLASIPDRKRLSSINYRIKDITSVHGVGIGSVGLQMYTMLLEGPTQTLENDIIVWFKQSLPSAVTRAVNDHRIGGYFKHDGHRTAISQRALQVYSDPWLGYAEIDGMGMFVMELPPYEASVKWSQVNKFDDLYVLVKDLGRIVAKIHCLSDEDSDHNLVTGSADQEILRTIATREVAFATALADWSAIYAKRVRDDHHLFIDAFRNKQFPSLRAQ